MPLFVQTDHHVIDVSKITFIAVFAKHVILHFGQNDKSVRLLNPEAERLMDGIAKLGQQHKLSAVRA